MPELRRYIFYIMQPCLERFASKDASTIVCCREVCRFNRLCPVLTLHIESLWILLAFTLRWFLELYSQRFYITVWMSDARLLLVLRTVEVCLIIYREVDHSQNRFTCGSFSLPGWAILICFLCLTFFLWVSSRMLPGISLTQIFLLFRGLGELLR